jgi:hypothetical protein
MVSKDYYRCDYLAAATIASLHARRRGEAHRGTRLGNRPGCYAAASPRWCLLRVEASSCLFRTRYVDWKSLASLLDGFSVALGTDGAPEGLHPQQLAEHLQCCAD